MKTTTIQIPNPSKELVAFLAETNRQKKQRMQAMREKFLHGSVASR